MVILMFTAAAREAYVGQLRDVLDELDEMVNKVSEAMHGIQDSSEQVSAGSNQLAVSAGYSGGRYPSGSIRRRTGGYRRRSNQSGTGEYQVYRHCT